jgi:hypothetical protein
MVLLLIAFFYTLYNRAPPEDGFCANLPDGTTRCFPSVAAYMYEASGRQLTFVPEDIPLDIAIHTLNAYVSANNTPVYVAPTSPPNEFESAMLAIEHWWNNLSSQRDTRPEITVTSPSGTTDQFCTNMPDMSERCFESVAAFIYEISGGQLTVVPDNIPLHIAIPTFNAFSIVNNNPQTVEPTPLPDGSTVEPLALTNAVQTLFGTPALTPSATP